MIYKSIAERLRIRLNSADFTLNSLLPGEKKLAEEFAVSRMTIRKAIDLLVAWGLVEVLKRQGKTVTSQVLIFEIMPAPPAIASQLRIQINEQIYFSRRVRFVEGKPLMLEDSYMPVKLFRNLSLQHLEGSKFEYIEQECGILIGGNYESLTPVLADRLLARQMKVAEHTPLLRITSLSYSESGEFLNYSVMFRNASEYQVEYHLRRLHPEKS
ncbi:GntR family transcriptional regulator [Shigella boydii]|nr:MULTISPECIES: GntR family transcriptional regulator [Enterobacteriaceae]MDX5596956.1 GntR family transcriptional regulator [Escherichia coli]RIG41083.1 GntR family transcriptional regulator [Shigella boydii]TXO44418.1 GntR family transcriptional regulator [Escherichia coli]HAL7177806.1 GntR family transcriptional regulator [Escherichia coli]